MLRAETARGAGTAGGRSDLRPYPRGPSKGFDGLVTETATAELPVLRCDDLPGGGRIEVRAMRPSDAESLAELYRSLAPEDLQRRFLAPYRPPPSFFERWAGLAERGGHGIVALHRPSDGGPAELVGEAGYAPLPNGNAELAMTIRPQWRGWLGAYLLDALAELAAGDGFADLEAEVLSSNGPMLALLRSRGAAVVGHDGWTTARLVIATSGRTPSWPPHDHRPRVLVEGSGTRWAGERAAEEAGFEVITCPGPDGGRHPRRRCPLLDGDRCPLVDGADAVVVVVRDPDGADDLGERLLPCLAGAVVETPVFVESHRPSNVGRRPPCRREITGPDRTAQVVAALGATLAPRHGASNPQAAGEP